MAELNLGKAVDVLNERYKAMGIDPQAECTIGEFGGTAHRLLVSGLDLNLIELEAAAHQMEAQADRLAGLAERGELAPFSIWLQGLLVGLIAAKRAHEGKADVWDPDARDWRQTATGEMES